MEAPRLLNDLTNLTDLDFTDIMGPKQKVMKQQGTAGKRSPKKKAKKRQLDDDDSDEEVLGKARLPSRGSRESRNKWDIETRVAAINRMAGGKMVSSVSDEMGIPVGVVSTWWLQREDIR